MDTAHPAGSTRTLLVALVAAMSLALPATATPTQPPRDCQANDQLVTEAHADSCGLQVLGAIDLSDGGTGQIAVHGDTAAVVRRDDGIVTLVDLSDPAAPTQLGSYDGGTGQAALDHPLDGDVAFSQDGRYLFHARQTSDYSNEGLHVLDVSDPNAPRRVDFAPQGGMLRVATAVIDDTELVVTLDAINGLTIFQVVRTPLSAHVVPLHVDALPALKVGGPASGGLVIVDDDPVFGVPTLYAADGTTGLTVLDLTVPADPTVLATWDEAGLAALAVDHVDGAVHVHAAAEYWFDDRTPPWLHTVRVEADGDVSEIARRSWGQDLSLPWKLGGLELDADGELWIAHGHAGLLAVDPATPEVSRASTDFGPPTPRPELSSAGWYAMDVTLAGDLVLATDAVTGELRVLRRTD